ncbi:MAG: hypothetical protein OXC69_00590 [Candidatus Tectomicrobia bacterium]|nr:hypothetical protein [Candidatus Tectomicrobia bacterium]
MARIAILTALLLATGIMTGNTTAEDETLFAHCAPMYLLVERLKPKGAQATGLTRQALVDAAEARLRSARLLVPMLKQMENPQTRGREQRLYINVNIVSFGFHVIVQLDRHMKDLGYGVPGFAVVWETGSTGTHGGDGTYILGVLSRLLDKFLAAYLRVNEGHCSR